MATLTTDIQNAEMWPIKAKGSVQRLNPLGDPTIEKYYHTSLESGRLLERNIGDAQHWLLQKKKDLMEKINLLTNMNNLAIDGKLSDLPRGIKYVKDSISILKQVSSFQKEVIGLISAVTQNIGILEMMEANIAGMVQQNLNALALTLNEICNWGLPNLPAIPNLFSDTIWHWNGFNFVPIGAFAQVAKSVKFDTNFAFNQCVVHLPNINIFSNYPSTLDTYGGLTFGTQLFVPPLGGIIPNTGFVLDDPNFISTMQNTSGAVFLPPNTVVDSTSLAQPFNVNSSMQGAVPNPATIISNYQMPSATYQSNIVSIVPALTNQTIEPTDPDYQNPDLVTRSANLQKALAHYVTLEAVVDSNYDPNLTAAWLLYMESARNGRQGVWIENFQVDYVTYLSPSLTYLNTNDVPWNAVLPSTVIHNSPTALPFVSTFTSATPDVSGNLLWRLSYLEASLLGYTRSQRWDAYASPSLANSFTGTDLDYRATSLDTTMTTVVLGETTAESPTPCTFPSAIGNVLQQVIATAAINIQNTPTYTTARPQFKFIYDTFGVAKQVDRFTQFWREFNANLQALLLQDPYLIQFVVSYPAALDSAIDPLGSPAIYNQVKMDAASRNRSWVPGTPLLNIPKAPLVTYNTAATPAAGQNGWQGTNFDPNVYLSRPDIQQLPMSVQIAMLRTNLSYAATQQMGATLSASIQDSITQANALLQDFTNIGWSAEVSNAPNAILVGASTPVSFDLTDFDLTGNVTSPNTFTIKTAGTYAIIVQLEWIEGDAGIRTGTLLQNGVALTTFSTDAAQPAPTTIQLSASPYLNVGDVISVVASHSLTEAQNVIGGSYISATLTDSTPPTTSGVSTPTNSLGTTLSFITESAIAELVAVYIDANGKVVPIDPTVVAMNGALPIYPIVTGVTLASAAAGGSVTTGSAYGSIYQVSGASFTVGGLLYAGAGGILTQDYSSVASTCAWIVVVGRAIEASQFIFEPHIPNLSS